MSHNVIPRARELVSHRVNGLNESLRVIVLDAPGSGGACHDYVILVPVDPHDDMCYQHNGPPEATEHYRICVRPSGPGEIAGVDLYLQTSSTVAYLQTFDTIDCGNEVKNTEYFNYTRIRFQNGPIKEQGVNGLSQEALLAVLIDRMEGFQAGQYKCHDNQLALDHLQYTRLVLHKRTMDRTARNVEGTRAQ